MVNWMDYYKIQEYKRKKFNKSQTARKLGINRETVGVYWDMTPEAYAARAEAAKIREKKADPHKDFVLECLLKYPDMSAAQLYDWIKERTCLETLDFQERCFRDYVKSIREEYDIKKPETSRQYEAMDELSPGIQAQVDMGEISLETVSGRHKKVYCFGMVMTHSRYKFILWQERPFTTDTFVQAHIKAFAFFGGRPREMVYDQDKILAVSENNGDIIYTEGFQNYVNEVKFDIFLCHGADPESKGLIENVVKYAKHGFAEHRIFRDIGSFNEDCIAWLKRTGNKKKHGTTQKIPAAVFSLEKEHLIPVSEYSFTVAVNDSIDYQVRKDNIVLYKGNRYRVPKGTYSPGKRVFMVVSDETVSITDSLSGEIYATHPLCHDKGQLIGQKRANRDKSKSLQEQENLIQQLFQEDELVSPFLEHIHQAKPRYYRDQLGVIRKLFEEWNTELLIQGLHYCHEKELYSAGDLKSSIIYLEQLKAEPRKTENLTALPSKYRGNTPEIRDLSVYEQAMERSVVNG
jgi:transposase